MKRMGGWLSGKTSLPASKSLTAIDEPQALNDALTSAALIMNDENERAEKLLAQGTSPFHRLGRSTTFFLRATLGFEKEMMEQTSACLAEAEESASEHHRRAVRDPTTAHQSKIYPAGSEYALCQAESQLMAAVIGVLNESLTESLRGFYKLRRAFASLHTIVEAENRYLDKRFSSSKTSLSSATAEKSGSAPYGSEETSATNSGVLTPTTDVDEEAEDLEFKDAEEGLSGQQTPVEYQGNLDVPGMKELNINDTAKNYLDSKASVDALPTYGTQGAGSKQDDLDFRADVSNDPIDVYIHSGVSLCYGLLQLILSMVPPAFSRILSILSFRGDRETGLRLLWRATAFKDNANGALAGAIVLGFHNALVALCDIHTREAFPASKLRLLLQDMRKLYPKSVMWILEEARMAMADRDLDRGVDILQNNPLKSPLKQVEALRVFETSMALMSLHRYEDCAEYFTNLVGMNNWSPGLYLYIAGCCYVELYRDHLEKDPKKASEYKKKADEKLQSVTAHTGKKRLMARQLPLDVFINRKLAKWNHRTKTRGCDMVDAIGVSPIEEMIYFCSGYRRMRPEHVELSLKALAWSEKQHEETDEPVDERAILAVLKATCLRAAGNITDAKKTIADEVYCYDLHQIKTCSHADNWPLPVAHYEHAVCLWQEAGGQDGDRDLLQQCSDELYKVEKWESFDLEARVGLKVTTARETLTRIGIKSS